MAKVDRLRAGQPGRRPGYPDPRRDGLLGRDRHAALLARLAAVPDRADHQRDGQELHRRGPGPARGRSDGVVLMPSPGRLHASCPRARPGSSRTRTGYCMTPSTQSPAPSPTRSPRSSWPTAASASPWRTCSPCSARTSTTARCWPSRTIELHRPLAEDADYEVRGEITVGRAPPVPADRPLRPHHLPLRPVPGRRPRRHRDQRVRRPPRAERRLAADSLSHRPTPGARSLRRATRARRRRRPRQQGSDSRAPGGERDSRAAARSIRPG